MWTTWKPLLLLFILAPIAQGAFFSKGPKKAKSLCEAGGDITCLYPQADFDPVSKLNRCSSTFELYKQFHYQEDLEFARDRALDIFLGTTSTITPNYTKVIVFDVDDTLLSVFPTITAATGALTKGNVKPLLDLWGDELPDKLKFEGRSANIFDVLAYANGVDGLSKFVEETINFHLGKGKLPPLKPIRELYQALYGEGFSLSIITSRPGSIKNGTAKNLKEAGFGQKCTKEQAMGVNRTKTPCYLELTMKWPKDKFSTTAEYKSMKRLNLQKRGYKIVGQVGDQFSDLLGIAASKNVILVPNPTLVTV